MKFFIILAVAISVQSDPIGRGWSSTTKAPGWSSTTKAPGWSSTTKAPGWSSTTSGWSTTPPPTTSGWSSTTKAPGWSSTTSGWSTTPPPTTSGWSSTTPGWSGNKLGWPSSTTAGWSTTTSPGWPSSTQGWSTPAPGWSTPGWQSNSATAALAAELAAAGNGWAAENHAESITAVGGWGAPAEVTVNANGESNVEQAGEILQLTAISPSDIASVNQVGVQSIVEGLESVGVTGGGLDIVFGQSGSAVAIGQGASASDAQTNLEANNGGH